MDMMSYLLSKKKLDEQKVKLAKLEKELSDYQAIMSQVNINQEATQKTSGYGIVSLPKNAANGQVSGIEVKGLTVTNLVKNGDFSNDTEWFSNGSYKIKITDGDLELYDAEGVTPNARSVSCYGKAGDKIYITAIAKPSSETTDVAIRYRDTNSNVATELHTFIIDNDTEVFLSNVITLPSDSYSGGPQVVFGHSDIPTESCFIKSKSMMAINLTETFGAGNEPTVEECDEIFANWFDGTKSTVSAFRIRSVSEDEAQESSAYVIATDADTGEILELRSLPNGTKDEIRVSEGKLIKRVSDEIVLDGSRSWALRTEYDNTIKFQLGSFSEDVILVKRRDKKDYFTNNRFDNITYNEGVDGNKEGLYFEPWLGLLFVIISKDKLTTLDANGFKQWLSENPTTLTYQLAEPEYIPVEVSGNLITYPSGTIYVEKAVADAGIYSNGITALYQDLPISEIEKLSKIDFTTGLETELDPSDCIISDDKLSFTHPELQDGDIVFFTYFYDVESTEGELEVEYYDSRYVIQDSVTGQFYKWAIAVADGVPSIELEEV